MAINTPTFRKTVGSVAMTSTYNTIVYDYYPLVSIADRPIFWDARYAQEWASSKVAYEHNKILSSGIGNKVIKILNRKVLGGKLIFKKGRNTETAKKTVDYIRRKCEEINFDEVLEAVDLKGLAGGSSYFVLNATKNKDILLDAIGIDQAYVTFKGNKPQRATIFINYIDDNNGSSISGSRYYLVEERYFKEDKPYTINKIYKSPIPQFEGAYASFTYGWRDDKTTKAEDITDAFINGTSFVNTSVIESIKNSGLIFGYEFELPFKNLGIIHFKSTATSLKHPHSKYGEPVLVSSFDLLWAYDFAFSILSKDLYTGRAMTFIPDSLNGNKILEQNLPDGEYARNFYNRSFPLPAIFDDEFIKVPNYDMEYQQPTTIQFDIRSEKIRTAMDSIAATIAQNSGISPSQLISELTPVNETKTAFEVQDETSASNTNLIRIRNALSIAINEVINEMCYFYGKKPEDVSVCFPPLEELNKTLTADYIVKLRSVNGMSDNMLVDIAYRDLTEAEKEEEIKRIKEIKTEEKTEVEKKNLNMIDNNLIEKDNENEEDTNTEESEEIVDEDKSSKS